MFKSLLVFSSLYLEGGKDRVILPLSLDRVGHYPHPYRAIGMDCG